MGTQPPSPLERALEKFCKAKGSKLEPRVTRDDMALAADVEGATYNARRANVAGFSDTAADAAVNELLYRFMEHGTGAGVRTFVKDLLLSDAMGYVEDETFMFLRRADLKGCTLKYEVSTSGESVSLDENYLRHLRDYGSAGPIVGITFQNVDGKLEFEGLADSLDGLANNRRLFLKERAYVKLQALLGGFQQIEGSDFSPKIILNALTKYFSIRPV
ncbi:MAG TPA: hypothetical protein VJJ82_00090 [Candidatus Nanoarchaeia archaeon]|nr:hypothetical protein [Candidatus Nanoarchaeia archaeon]